MEASERRGGSVERPINQSGCSLARTRIIDLSFTIGLLLLIVFANSSRQALLLFVIHFLPTIIVVVFSSTTWLSPCLCSGQKINTPTQTTRKIRHSSSSFYSIYWEHKYGVNRLVILLLLLLLLLFGFCVFVVWRGSELVVDGGGSETRMVEF